jgi:hypothetical protein
MGQAIRNTFPDHIIKTFRPTLSPRGFERDAKRFIDFEINEPDNGETFFCLVN